MSSRPVATPEIYSGEGPFDVWADHFESVAHLNQWTDEDMAKWLAVRLVGRAQTALKRLPATTRASYSATKEALLRRFEPNSKRGLYAAEFQSRQKQPSEDWASFADDLKVLADKAFPDLEEAARETLTVDRFLSQLQDPQLAFSVRQKNPQTIDEAVTATLEIQSHLRLAARPLSSPTDTAVAGVGSYPAHDRVTELMEQLVSRMDKLEADLATTRSQITRQNERPQQKPQQNTQRPPRQPVICRRCGREGHYSRGCAAPRTRNNQGN